MTPSDLCELYRGYHHDDSEFALESGRIQWPCQWPVIDRNGILTGEVFNSDNYTGVFFALTQDRMWAIRLSELPEEEQVRISGVANGVCGSYTYTNLSF